MAATCESFVSGAKAGLDPLTMTKILGIETGKNAASARIIPEQVATRTFDYGMEIGAVSRSLRLAAEEAARLGVTPWILDKTRLLYGLAVRLGHASDDVSRLMMQYEKWACIEVISPLNNDMTKQTSLSSGSKK
jgi:3-hydroxyisobutyrate dehydrogenase-like beta-hydroxyacid dehydrogenase